MSKKKKKNSIYLKSINKYIVLDEISDYNRSNIKRCIYIKGKPIKITSKEFDNIMLKSKDIFLKYLKDNTNNNSDGISYNKWCKDKLKLINKISFALIAYNFWTPSILHEGILFVN